jgi:hypothetical protein
MLDCGSTTSDERHLTPLVSAGTFESCALDFARAVGDPRRVMACTVRLRHLGRHEPGHRRRGVGQARGNGRGCPHRHATAFLKFGRVVVSRSRDYASGRMSARADLIVLGAGMVEVSMALHLQKRGRDGSPGLQTISDPGRSSGKVGRGRLHVRDQLRNSGGNSFSAPQPEQVAMSTATRCLGPMFDAITKRQSPQR